MTNNVSNLSDKLEKKQTIESIREGKNQKVFDYLVKNLVESVEESTDKPLSGDVLLEINSICDRMYENLSVVFGIDKAEECINLYELINNSDIESFKNCLTLATLSCIPEITALGQKFK